MELDTKTHGGIQHFKKTNNTTTMPSTLQRRQRQHPINRRKQKGTGSDIMAKTRRRNFKTTWYCVPIFIGHRKKVPNKRTGAISISLGTGTLSFIHIRKAN